MELRTIAYIQNRRVMKNREKFISFIVSILGLMALSGVSVYAAMDSGAMSLLEASVISLVSGIGLGTAMYFVYDIDER